MDWLWRVTGSNNSFLLVHIQKLKWFVSIHIFNLMTCNLCLINIWVSESCIELFNHWSVRNQNDNLYLTYMSDIGKMEKWNIFELKILSIYFHCIGRLRSEKFVFTVLKKWCLIDCSSESKDFSVKHREAACIMPYYWQQRKCQCACYKTVERFWPSLASSKPKRLF